MIDVQSEPGVGCIRFFHADGHYNVRHQLDELLESASASLRGAVCFFCSAGLVLLGRHIPRLARDGSFFIASVDWPTDIDALYRLHRFAPGHVYIHLGAVTPEEELVGRALMHSKLFLADAEMQSALWVGSHNLTASALEGANCEAGVYVEASPSHPAIVDARSHLEKCRDEAELFDPSKIDTYKEIQGKRGKVIGEKEDILVINAENHVVTDKSPFTVHVKVHELGFDNHLVRDRQVHLYLHPQGTLRLGVPFDLEKATLWVGQVSGATNTEKHPRNRGAFAELPSADYEIEIKSPPPQLRAPGTFKDVPISQGILRLDRQLRHLREVYSSTPLLGPRVFVSEEQRRLMEVDKDMVRFFTRESRDQDKLVYQALVRVQRDINVAAYSELIDRYTPTGMSYLFSESVNIVPKRIEAKKDIEPFFFVSRYHLKSR